MSEYMQELVISRGSVIILFIFWQISLFVTWVIAAILTENKIWENQKRRNDDVLDQP